VRRSGEWVFPRLPAPQRGTPRLAVKDLRPKGVARRGLAAVLDSVAIKGVATPWC
jgi:hypothetical protein